MVNHNINYRFDEPSFNVYEAKHMFCYSLIKKYCQNVNNNIPKIIITQYTHVFSLQVLT